MSDQTRMPAHARELLGRLRRPIDSVSLSFGYRLALLGVAVIMVLLPLSYVALTALIGYATYHHARYNGSILEGSGAMHLYVGGILAGCILLVFMIKPLLARRRRPPEALPVTREQEPLLHEFVDRLSEALGAPKPSRIDLDAEVNASAHLRRGMRSLLGKDLVLTIGTPLVAGLSARQLGGVLAHELGHFSQTAGMKLCYVVRATNAWFHRVVYERDRFDEELTGAAESGLGSIFLGVLLHLVRLLIWLTRRLLFCFMYVGHAASSWLMRQMEFDADRRQVRFAGLEAYESTMAELPRLSAAERQAYSEISELWDKGQLPADLASFIVSCRREVPAETLESIERQVMAEKTSLFATHPSVADRLDSARRDGSNGVFDSSLPASALFVDFATSSRQVTQAHFSRALGEEALEATFISLEEHLERRRAEQAEFETLGSFFRVLSLLRPPRVDVEAPATRDVLSRLVELRNALAQGAAGYESHSRAWGEQRRRQIDSSCALALLQGGLRIEGDSFQLAGNEVSDALEARSEAALEQSRLAPLMEPFERLQEERLALALSIAANERHDLSKAAADLRRALPSLLELDVQIKVVETMASNGHGLDASEQFQAAVNDATSKLEKLLVEARDQLAETPDLFSEREGATTLDLFLVPPEEVGWADFQSLHASAAQATRRGFACYFRAMGRLAQEAERAETELGLEPVPALESEPGSAT